MASLGEVVGALISQISKGRSQADIATLEVARVYKEHPLLAEFPIPRLTLDEVVIDLKMSIATSPISERTITAKTRAEIMTRFENLIKNLVGAELSLGALSREHSELLEIWTSGQSQLIQKVSILLPSDMEVEPWSIAEGVAAIIGGHLTTMTLTPAAKVPMTKARDFLNKNIPQIETKLAKQIHEIIVEALKSQPSATDRIEVLVTAAELQSIPPEKITTMRFTLQESDRSWAQIETDKGETRDKLVPS